MLFSNQGESSLRGWFHGGHLFVLGGVCRIHLSTSLNPFSTIVIPSQCIYTFENRCLEEPDLPLGDETVKVIANTRGTVGEISDELKELLLYFDKGIATGAYTRKLDDAVKSVKAGI